MAVIANAPQFLYEGTLTFGSVTNSSTNWAEQTVTLPTGVTFPNGGAGGGLIALELPNLQANLAFCGARAISATQFKIRFFNATGGNLTPTGTAAKLVMF